MPGFGERLRRERESRDTALREIADSTQIGYRYLEALEREELDELPGSAFGKLYIRAYAEVLGIDPGPLIAEYDRAVARRGHPVHRDEPRPEAESAPGPPVERRRERFARIVDEAPAARRVDRSAPPHEPDEEIAAARRRLVEARSAIRRIRGPQAEPPDGAAAATAPATEPERFEPPAGPGVAGRPTWHWLAAGLALVIVLWALAALLGGSEPAPPAPVESAVEPAPVVPPRSEPRSGAVPPPPVEKTVEQPPEPAAEPATPPAGRLSVTDSGLGTAVVGHRLQGRADRFPEGSVVWFQTRVVGGGPGDRIRHDWYRGSGRVQSIELEVGGANWRTHSKKTLWGRGDWRVEARDPEGRLLARAEFRVGPRR